MAILIASMYCVFTYIWLIFMVNVGKYTIYIYICMDAMGYQYLESLKAAWSIIATGSNYIPPTKRNE